MPLTLRTLRVFNIRFFGLIRWTAQGLPRIPVALLQVVLLQILNGLFFAGMGRRCALLNLGFRLSDPFRLDHIIVVATVRRYTGCYGSAGPGTAESPPPVVGAQ